ncbi:putative hydro-lyase [Xylophilus rhododendri]|uniref:Putative hydro-lyase GT347_18020 n=1 Tax=Xylophilus rhododendri TaxID=2697032 RepID=A0A857JEJ1_9BURK|nr:putative hydro-lyase [Xylophilus rhododendri]QHJ01612.1 putative hydro-lyase [Xylophilus rhododendri]
MAQASSPSAFRQLVRAGRFTAQTAGQCPGFTQGNLAIMPSAYADEFLRFARRNPKSCPVIGMSEPGDPSVPELGQDIDLRTDIPGYCVFRDGRMVEEVPHLRELWREDLVGFVIGCSLSFEEALLEGGVPVRHIEQGTTVPMYDTDRPNGAAGRFGGNGVVSMRPMSAAQAIRAIQITSRFPATHGAPVHFGDPAEIGIADIDRPDYGERAEIRPGEIPVFWACGVTPQQAIRSAGLPFAITHKPGHMLVTDVRNSHLAVL